jgi:hypothetical protein
MSSGGRVFLGALTFWPPVYFVLFLLMFAITAASIPVSEGGGPPFTFKIIFPLHLFTIFEMMALTVYYGVNVYREPLLQGDRKILWMVIVLLGGFIGQSIYYVLWLWKRNPSVLGSAATPLPPASWQSDATGRHEARYWDGTRWTSFVSDKGRIQEDPIWHTPEPEAEPEKTFDQLP